MFDYLNTFGHDISWKWRSSGCNPEYFPDLVHNNIDQDRLSYSRIELMETIFSDKYRKYQTQSVFSEYNCRIYSDDLIYIELLHWNVLDTDLHNHDFSGVLYQVQGESIDVSYEFNGSGDEMGDRPFDVGRLDVRRVDALTPHAGAGYQKIHTGFRYNHAVSHLRKGTVSLIIRTQPLDGMKQSIFFPPSVRIFYDFRPEDRKFSRLFSYLYTVDRDLSFTFLEHYIENTLIARPNRLMSYLARNIDFCSDRAVVERLAAILRQYGYEYVSDILASVHAFRAYRTNSASKASADALSDRRELSFRALSYGDDGFYQRIRAGYHNRQ